MTMLGADRRNETGLVGVRLPPKSTAVPVPNALAFASVPAPPRWCLQGEHLGSRGGSSGDVGRCWRRGTWTVYRTSVSVDNCI